MTLDEIVKYCFLKLDETSLVNSWGEKGILYNPDNKLKRGVYILTIKESDRDNDKGSNLNRENAYRVNLGVRKDTFRKMFVHILSWPSKGCVVNMDYDFFNDK